MQNQDGILWGFLFSLNFQCWQRCAASVAATYHSQTETRNVMSLHQHSCRPSSALSELVWFFVNQNPSDLHPSLPVRSEEAWAMPVELVSAFCIVQGLLRSWVLLPSWQKDAEGRGDGALDPVLLVLYLRTSCYSYSINSLHVNLMVMKYWLHFGALMSHWWVSSDGSVWGVTGWASCCNLGKGGVHSLR